MGDSKKSVPDSCCLFEVQGCGRNIFEITDIRVLVQKININGCLFVIKRRLDDQVSIILMIFTGVGSILVMVEMLCVILACCLANTFSREQEEEEDDMPSHYDMR